MHATTKLFSLIPSLNPTTLCTTSFLLLSMEGSENGSAATGSSRWNPTKEQINLLENLYKQGIRTPTAEQIQQITGRLRAYGHIEGKNVFYWFQNHKARQRQKQKQEGMAYFNRLLHKTTRFLYPPPCSNVACGPYYLKQGEAGLYTHSPKVMLPGGLREKASTGQKVQNSSAREMCNAAGTAGFAHQSQYDIYDNHGLVSGNQKTTLALFPLQPTGDLQGIRDVASSSGNSMYTPSSSSETSDCRNGNHEVDSRFYDCNRTFFDFFSGAKESDGVAERRP